MNTNVEFVLGGKPLPGHDDLLKLPAKFIGGVEQKDLPALYSGAKFLAFVSKEEGFGVPILEAMACDTPVLTSDQSSMEEISGKARRCRGCHGNRCIGSWYAAKDRQGEVTALVRLPKNVLTHSLVDPVGADRLALIILANRKLLGRFGIDLDRAAKN